MRTAACLARRAARLEKIAAYTAAYLATFYGEEAPPDATPDATRHEKRRAWGVTYYYDAQKRHDYSGTHKLQICCRTACYWATRRFGEAVPLDVWKPIYFGTCFSCGVTPACGVDHIIPFTRGGRNVIENLRPACMPCNRKKGNRS